MLLLGGVLVLAPSTLQSAKTTFLYENLQDSNQICNNQKE